MVVSIGKMATTVYEREVMGSGPRGLTLRAREVIHDSRMWLMESLCANLFLK